MCGHCKAEDASVCEECGVLVADGYQVIHKRQHPHPYDEDPYSGWESHPERHGCVVCRLPEDASVHEVSAADLDPVALIRAITVARYVGPFTPVTAAMRERSHQILDEAAALMGMTEVESDADVLGRARPDRPTGW